MILLLERRVSLDEADESFAKVVTEARRWTKGWVARLEGGKRRFLQHLDSDLSRAGYGRRHFRLADPGQYEADSVCASLRSHRVRFEVQDGGIILLRRSTNPERCGHLRAFDRSATPGRPNPVNALDLLRSIVTPDDPREAAISLGGHLEQHLQRLCEDHGLRTHVGGRSKGIDALSAALKAAGVYPTEDHKVVIRLASVRKRAQHDGEAIEEEVIYAAVVDFCKFRDRYPATVSVL